MAEINTAGEIRIPTLVENWRVRSRDTPGDHAVLVDLVGKQKLAIVDSTLDHTELKPDRDNPGLPFLVPGYIRLAGTYGIRIRAIHPRTLQISLAEVRSHQPQSSLYNRKELIDREDRIVKLRRDRQPLPAVHETDPEIILACTCSSGVKIHLREIRL